MKPSSQNNASFFNTSVIPWKAILFIVGVAALMVVSNAQNAYDWMPYDAFDEIDDRMHAITAQNCRGKPASELRLPHDAVGQLPKFNRLLSFIESSLLLQVPELQHIS